MNRWYELVVEGSHEALRGFVRGFEHGRRESGQFVFGRDIPLAADSLHEKIRRLLSRGSHSLVFGPEPAVRGLADGVRARGGDAGLAISHLREVTGAAFSFTAEAFSRDVAEQIRAAMLASLPEGAAIVDASEETTTDEDARGTELYSPAHAFRYRLSATCTGSLPAVLEMHRRSSELEFVEPGEIRLDARDIAEG